MFCLYTSSKLSRSYFEFSLKVKAMGLNGDYLLKSFLLHNSLEQTRYVFYKEMAYPRHTWLEPQQDIPFRDYKDVISHLISTIEFKMTKVN